MKFILTTESSVLTPLAQGYFGMALGCIYYRLNDLSWETVKLHSLHLSPSPHEPPVHSSYCFVLPDKVTAGIREVSVTQIKDKVIATTLTQKGLAKEAHWHVDDFFFFLDPILKKQKRKCPQ